MSSKGNYSEVQKMDRASVLKKVLYNNATCCSSRRNIDN